MPAACVKCPSTADGKGKLRLYHTSLNCGCCFKVKFLGMLPEILASLCNIISVFVTSTTIRMLLQHSNLCFFLHNYFLIFLRKCYYSFMLIVPLLIISYTLQLLVRQIQTHRSKAWLAAANNIPRTTHSWPYKPLGLVFMTCQCISIIAHQYPPTGYSASAGHEYLLLLLFMRAAGVRFCYKSKLWSDQTAEAKEQDLGVSPWIVFIHIHVDITNG